MSGAVGAVPLFLTCQLLPLESFNPCCLTSQEGGLVHAVLLRISFMISLAVLLLFRSPEEEES